MALATVPGYPRIGKRRELKRALEGYWSGKLAEADLLAAVAEIRRASWDVQHAAGLDLVPVNDFALYDHVLDAAALVGAVPARYGWTGELVDLDTVVAMARGRGGTRDVRAMEMTKWFDTNYHYIVPEFEAETEFRIASDKPFAELTEAQGAGIPAKVALLGPMSLLLLGKAADGVAPLDLLDRLLPVYAEVITRLAAAGAEWIQLDEPALVMDRTATDLAAVERAYAALAAAKGEAKLLIQTAYGHVGEAYETLAGLPVDGIGLDLVRGHENLALIERYGFPAEMWLAAGVVDGRNIWLNDLATSLRLLDRIGKRVSTDRLMVSTSCSLLHVPIDVRLEEDLDPEVRSWMAFAEQKLDEVVLLARALNVGEEAVADRLEVNRRVLAAHAASPRRNNPAVRTRLGSLSEADTRRSVPSAARAASQRQRLDLPLLPTTTIGSFPQTAEVRAERRRFERGEIDAVDYERFVESQIRGVIAEQERLGLDVLVHGEYERNDMVQYFGEQLAGFAFTRHGWVQSYGSRYVRPPIIVGDVSRPEPMTVRWATYAQGLTERPVKGMLTGPVTILNWSFVRDDQPRSETCRQIALAIRDEVADLERAGIRVIQVDEPALREGLPLRRAEWAAYLRWA
ncbi:MAG: 5-methyltetrahydropteroyltriglutamate--homocysteine S-methyltransferase, partial [Chloroflexota bacterium]|nr:5-methyltetrahydropteroyltriglutamate--homocysteine S-methyltransferase [Chloroflexota bacterium]